MSRYRQQDKAPIRKTLIARRITPASNWPGGTSVAFFTPGLGDEPRPKGIFFTGRWQ